MKRPAQTGRFSFGERVVAMRLPPDRLSILAYLRGMNEGQAFWNWIITNIPRLEAFETLPEDDAASVLNEAQEQLDTVAQGLYFEFSVSERPYEFIVTADGDTTLFPAVRTLVEAAPEIPGWSVVAFKQAQPDLQTCEWEGTSLELADLRFQPLFSRNDADRIALRFLVGKRAAVRSEETLSALHMIVETLLGEEVAATTIAHIDVAGNGEDPGNYAPVEALAAFVRQFRS